MGKNKLSSGTSTVETHHSEFGMNFVHSVWNPAVIAVVTTEGCDPSEDFIFHF